MHVATDDPFLARFTMDACSEEIYWTDRDGRFIYVNDAVCRALGYSREEMLADLGRLDIFGGPIRGYFPIVEIHGSICGVFKLPVTLFEFCGRFLNAILQDGLLRLALFGHLANLANHAVEFIRQYADLVRTARGHMGFEVASFRALRRPARPSPSSPDHAPRE